MGICHSYTGCTVRIEGLHSAVFVYKLCQERRNVMARHDPCFTPCGTAGRAHPPRIRLTACPGRRRLASGAWTFDLSPRHQRHPVTRGDAVHANIAISATLRTPRARRDRTRPRARPEPCAERSGKDSAVKQRTPRRRATAEERSIAEEPEDARAVWQSASGRAVQAAYHLDQSRVESYVRLCEPSVNAIDLVDDRISIIDMEYDMHTKPDRS